MKRKIYDETTKEIWKKSGKKAEILVLGQILDGKLPRKSFLRHQEIRFGKAIDQSEPVAVAIG